ncbi:MAG: RraA family protein [Alphaproteobacteria bacterium]|nr:RraA family protein [Alphaproteobacteria bacterium]
MPDFPDPKLLEALRAWDTPTICNALEVVAPHRRATGFTRRPLVAPFPDLKPIVGYARTALIRSREPHPRDRESATKMRIGYYEHIAEKPMPSIAVLQDIDAPDTGFGAFWGEVQTHVHHGLGCAGVITDGSVRDLDAMSPGFFVLAGSVMPSHAHVHLVDFGGTVSVAGMTVSANDIIHADRHGAVVIPADVIGKIQDAIDLLTRREKVIIDASKQPGFSIERLRQAFKEQEDIH